MVAVEDCDTRRLVRHLRDRGAMRGGVATELGPEELLARVREHPVLDGRDLAAEAAGPARALGADGPRVVAIDCGMKESIARGLVGGRLPAGGGAGGHRRRARCSPTAPTGSSSRTAPATPPR